MKRLSSFAFATGVLLAVALISPAEQSVAGQPSVKHLVDDHAGSYSPDGKTIVFQRVYSTLRDFVDPHPVPQRSVILVMGADGSRKRALRHPGARYELSPTFSPDGRSILFVRDGRIYLMRRDGSGARPVSPDNDFEHECPVFSPDGRMISFWRGSGESGGYYVMNADGSDVRRIVGGERFAWGCPSWFPDGKRVAFTKRYDVYIASLDDMTSERITDVDGSLYRPAVSPDGRWIACDGDGGFGEGIVVMRADGTGMKRITTAQSEIEIDAVASWSPDGRQILFSGNRERFEGSGVYVVNRDGNGLRRLSNLDR